MSAATGGHGDADLTLLLYALASPGTVFVLGAGASAPDVPVVSELPAYFRPFARHLSSFPASGLPDSPLRQLIAPLIEEAKVATSFEQVWPGMMTAGTIAVLIEHMIAQAHRRRLPQYGVFRLFSIHAAIVSFNWDGLAQSRCPQEKVLHPHGAVPPRPVVPGELERDLEWAQEDDLGYLRGLALPGLVMPGEEDSPSQRDTHERVFRLWLGASDVVILGYSFGVGSSLRYDRVWLDAFVEAMRERPETTIHVVSPDPEPLREHLCEQIGRGVNVYSWPFRWNVFAEAILKVARDANAYSIVSLADSGRLIRAEYDARMLAHENR